MYNFFLQVQITRNGRFELATSDFAGRPLFSAGPHIPTFKQSRFFPQGLNFRKLMLPLYYLDHLL